jgi:hypothetical protein
MKGTTMKHNTSTGLCCLLAAAAIGGATATAADKAGNVPSHSQGLHGYIGFGHEKLPYQGGYAAGMGFYAAVWPLVDQALADFQIGLPSSWIQPDNSDNKDKPSDFYAYYTRLEYDDHSNTGQYADLIVKIGTNGRFVFCRIGSRRGRNISSTACCR